MEIARGDKALRVMGRDAKPKRRVTTTPKQATEAAHDTAKLKIEPRTRFSWITKTLGLRFEESAKLDAKKALKQALNKGELKIIDGTKGGRLRHVRH